MNREPKGTESTEAAINVRLRFFAKVRDLAGGRCEATYQCNSPHVRVGDLIDKISVLYNFELIKNSIVISHNEVFCLNLDEVIHVQENDEIAFIPPISGG